MCLFYSRPPFPPPAAPPCPRPFAPAPQALQAAFGAWPQASAPQRGEGGEGGEGGGLRALDLACGSGEATEALEHCLKIRVEAADPYTFEDVAGVFFFFLLEISKTP